MDVADVIADLEFFADKYDTRATLYDVAPHILYDEDISLRPSAAKSLEDVLIDATPEASPQRASSPAPTTRNVPPSSPDVVQPAETAFRLLDIDVDVVSSRNVDYLSTSIVYDEMGPVLEDDAFIDTYVSSLGRLNRYKYNRYKTLVRDVDARKNRMLAEFQQIKRIDASARLGDTFPELLTIARLQVQLAGLRDDVKQTIDSPATPEDVRASLQDAVFDERRGLASIVGRDQVKDMLTQMIYSFAYNYRTFTDMFNNILLLGPAGVGKTRIATIIAYVLGRSKLLARQDLVVATRADLLAGFIGGTAPKTRSLLLSSLDSVLFLDEAYEIPSKPGATKDFGDEAVTELVNFIDKYIGMSMVVGAGYEREMREDFLGSNKGLPRRFPYVITLPHYTSKELAQILVDNLRARATVTIDNGTASVIYTLIKNIQREEPDAFRNQAGDMLNLANNILRAISGASLVTWVDGDAQHNFPIILDAFNTFLRSANLGVQVND